MKKVLVSVVLATALAGCLQSQPNPAPVPAPAVEPTKVDLKKLLDQFDIFGLLIGSTATAPPIKISKLARNRAKHP